MKLFTDIPCEKISEISLSDPICVLGSCFADEIGARLEAGGFNVLRNPFGTLYNPASIASAVARLDSAEPFTPADCVEMGAGAGRVGSFSHHTSFARPTAEEFLAYANARLKEDAARWRACKRVILTLGTAWVWRALERTGQPIVANCLKRPAREFSHELLSVEACTELLRSIIEAHPDKQFLLTVSPIRHLGDGAHANTISKSTLHLAVEHVTQPADGNRAAPVLPDGEGSAAAGFVAPNPVPAPAGSEDGCRAAGTPGRFPSAVRYFPAYEIVMDELRDYRFYAEDLVHPAPATIQIVWERFLDACTVPAERERILAAERASRAANHRPLQ